MKYKLMNRRNRVYQKQLDLTLSGTGPVRFPAWVGVLRYIEERGYHIRRLAGTSGGALVGGLYAAGMSVDDLESVLLKTDYSDFARTSWWRVAKAIAWPKAFGGGYMNNGYKLEKFLHGLIGKKSFKHAKGLHIFTTDMCNGVSKIFNWKDDYHYSIAKAIRASISLPIIWNGVPYKYKKGHRVKGIKRRRTVLMDGGLRNNFPIDYFEPTDLDVISGKKVPLVGFTIEHDFCTIKEQYSFKDIGGSVISNMIGAADRKYEEDSKGNYIMLTHGDLDDGNPYEFDINNSVKAKWIEAGYKVARDNWGDLINTSEKEVDKPVAQR